MRKLQSIIIVICLLAGLAVPAFADDATDTEIPPPIFEAGIPAVTTLEELQAAIDVAEMGDTIAIAQGISIIGEPLETDKDIFIARADGFITPIFYMYSDSEINGFNFLESEYGSETISVGVASNGVTIKNCSFSNEEGHTRPYVFVGGGTVNIDIENCTFTGNDDTALDVRANTELKVNDCIFEDNKASMQGGAINSDGILALKNCTFIGNSAVSGGGVYCSDELTITNCRFWGIVSRLKTLVEISFVQEP